MRNKRIFTLSIVIGLLAVLTTTAYAATGNHPSSPTIMGTWLMTIPKTATSPETNETIQTFGDPTIVGTWQMTIPKTATSPETNETMQTFFADGNYLETNNNSKAGSTGQGLWIGAGNTYLYTFQVFTSDAQGNYTGKRIVHGTIHMDDADHFTGKGSADVVDAAGKVTKNVFSATFEGTRMEMQVP